MARKPRPLSQPVLTRSQWVRITFLGLLMAIATLSLEAYFAPAGAAVLTTMGFVVFALFNVVIALSCRSEIHSAFNRDILSDRRQLMLYGLALLLTFLPTELGFTQRSMGLASLTFEPVAALRRTGRSLLLIDEVVKFFLRRRHGSAPTQKSTTVALPAAASPIRSASS